MHQKYTEHRYLQRGALVLCALIAAIALFVIYILHETELQRVARATQSLSASVEQTLDRLITSIDIVLQSAADDITERKERGLKPGDDTTISQVLDRQAKRLQHVAFIRGTDAKGDVVFGSGRPLNTVNLSDRKFFAQLRDHPDEGLYIAQPVVGKIAGKPVITMARRINKPNGEFDGTIYGSIEVSEFTQLLSKIRMQDGGSIAVRDKDRSLLVRHVFGTENTIPLGSTQLATPFRQALERSPDSGSYISDSSSVDPVVRAYAYQRNQNFGFLVTVGFPIENALASWRKQSIVIGILAALLSLTVLALARQISKSRDRLEGMVSSLELSQTRLQENHLNLQRAEEMHLAILENLHLGVVVHAPDSGIIFCNTQASTLLDLTKEQMLGKKAIDPAWCFVDQDEVALKPEQYPVSRVIHDRKAFKDMELGVRIPGRESLKWLEVSAFPEFLEDGTLKQVVVNFFEITKRREAERARERVSRALRLVTDTNMTLSLAESKTQLLADVCRLICEKGGHMMAWVGYAQNDAEKMVRPVAYAGPQEFDIHGLKVSWDENSDFGNGIIGQALRTGKSQVNQDYDNNPSMAPWRLAARQFGVKSNIALPFFKKNGVRAALSIYSKNSDAFSADEVALLEELTANMAHELDALEERRLRFEAESASQAKANFLANMSHEIRTPLNAIAGMAYLIRRDGLTPMQEDKLGKLLKSSNHLLNILNDVLDLSKIDAGKLTLSKEAVHIDEIVTNVISMVLERAKSKGLDLRSEIDAFPDNLLGDVTRLQQALLNFASNAVKFTEAGHIILRARIVEDQPEDMLIRFEVVDTGIGIDTAALERLFNDFEQADNTTTRRFGGTGLGLSITRRLARLMGGDAGATSTPGQGSCFWFSSRVAKGQVQAISGAANSAEECVAMLKDRHHGKWVLIAEDEPFNSEIACVLLEEAGFMVEVAEDGLQAIEMAAIKDYCLILMDMQMPRMDGLEATRQIRQLPLHSATPILAMTANAFSEDRDRCIAAGMNDFIAKPAPRGLLYQKILELLGNAPA